MNSNPTRRQFLQTATVATLAAGIPSTWAQAPADKKITLAFIGVAHIHTPEFIRLAKSRPDVKVKFVWDHDAARAQKRAQELEAQAVNDLRQIWSDREVDAVVICSETNRHHELVLAAAKAGKHMFVEKPLGISGKESVEMAHAIEKANLLFTTGYFMRINPRHLFLKNELSKGNFGKVTRVRGSNCHSGALEGWFDTEWRWMADPKISGVGAFGDLGTHKLDILMWFFGGVESVTGQIKTVTSRYGDCDETGEALIKFQNGVLGTLAAGWVDIEDPVQLLISGTEGHATMVDNHLYYRSKHVSDSNSKDPLTSFPPGPKPPMIQFINAVGGSKDEPLVKPSEAAARVTVMEAIYKGARGNKWVNVS
jgi:predicted dehydrogenase